MQEPKFRQAKSRLVRHIEARLNTKENLGPGNTIPIEPESQIFRSTAGVFMPSSVSLLGKECSQALCIFTSLKAQETVNKKGMAVLRLPPPPLCSEGDRMEWIASNLLALGADGFNCHSQMFCLLKVKFTLYKSGWNHPEKAQTFYLKKCNKRMSFFLVISFLVNLKGTD